MNPRFEIVRTNAGYHVRFKGANGETVMSTEVYNRKEDAQHAVDLVSPYTTFTVTEVDERTRG